MIYRLIDPLAFSHLRNDEQFMVHTDLKKIFDRAGAAALGIVPEMETYNALIKKVDNAQSTIVKSDLTAKISDADAARDEILRGLSGQITAMKKHPIQNFRDAGTRLEIVMKTFGDIASKSLNSETASIINLLQELRQKYKSDIDALSLAVWVDELERLNNEVDSLMNARFEQGAQKTEVVLKTARAELDAACKVIMERIDSGMIFSRGAEVFASCVRLINEVTAKYNTTLLKRSGGKIGTKTKRWSAGLFGETVNDDNLGTGEDNSESDTGHQNQIPLWTADIDYTKMNIGDKRRTSDGRIWEAIDLGQVHRDPAGEFGHFGWREVK